MKKHGDRKTWGQAAGLWRRLLQGLRWLVVAALTVLFFVGLFLELPWKLLVLLALIPLVVLLVPHRLQKYVWLTLTLLLLGLFIWIHLPEENTAQWGPYRFEMHENPELLTNPRNAAVHYQAIFDHYGDSIFTYPLIDEQEDLLTFRAPWQAVSHPHLSEWLRLHEEGINRMVEVARMELCRFEKPIDLRKFQKQKWRIKQMKTWSNILIRSANEDLGCGRDEAALEKMLAVLGMARHLYAQGNLLDQATGFALESRAARALHRYLIEHTQAADDLEVIERHYQQIQTGWPEVWASILPLEKIRVKNSVGLFYQVNKEGRTRISRNLGQGLHESLDYPAYRFLAYNRVSRLMAICLWLSIPSNPETVANIVDEQFDRYSRVAEQGEDIEASRQRAIWLGGANLRAVTDWLARQQVSFYYPLSRQARQHEALDRVTRILGEIKQVYLRTGVWPGSLEELVGPEPAGLYFDPTSELPFVYRLTGEGFLLYSVGKNGCDDGGENNPLQGQDDIVFWPTFGSRIFEDIAIEMP